MPSRARQLQFTALLALFVLAVTSCSRVIAWRDEGFAASDLLPFGVAWVHESNVAPPRSVTTPQLPQRAPPLWRGHRPPLPNQSLLRLQNQIEKASTRQERFHGPGLRTRAVSESTSLSAASSCRCASSLFGRGAGALLLCPCLSSGSRGWLDQQTTGARTAGSGTSSPSLPGWSDVPERHSKLTPSGVDLITNR